jgi:putative ABC transport system permease protein
MAGNPWYIAIVAGMAGGVIAGMVTEFIHAWLGVNALLSGILVMTALYSVNLTVMGRSNIPLLETDNIFTALEFTADVYLNYFLVVFLLAALVFLLMRWFLRTDFGLALRATGQSEKMVATMGISVNRMKLAGLGIANGLTALSASLITQMQQFADINMGIGIVIFGLGAVMIGESLQKLSGRNGIGFQLVMVLVGCLLFRLIMAFTLASGVDPNLMKLFNAAVVLVFVSLPVIRKKIQTR